MKTVIAFVLAVLTGLTCQTAASAFALKSVALSTRSSVLRADWQVPEQLPPRFRNHCSIDKFSARPYCSNHCGADYQFFFCSPQSFGCCHIARGYCDWKGLLRCAP